MPVRRGKAFTPFLALLLVAIDSVAVENANRLTYLDEADPFYVGLNFPKLTTPQWVGETNVEAVVILSIDDMREPAKYEAFLRPILNRLKQIDGRTPVSIFCNALDPTHPQLQAWLKEGLSLEIHTLSHPCPCLAKGEFAAAENTYHGCVDLLNRVPGNKPVAFRMPCCDSMNSPSPRFYGEIFNRTNSAGQFLTIDSSVMNIPTADDRSLPRELVRDADGRPRFQKYLPTETNATTRVSMKSFVTTIQNYPYPYVIGNLCWEFPGMVPSDWEAHNLHGSTNSITVGDWKAALDMTVLKQGVLSFIFHPHGWVRADQMVEFIDYAVKRYGSKIKFLTFREAQERLDKNLLLGNPLRDTSGRDNGVRLVDVDADGFMDVVIGNARTKKTRIWNSRKRDWSDSAFPVAIDNGLRFGVVDDHVVMARSDINERQAWHFEQGQWVANDSLLRGFNSRTTRDGRDAGVRFRDVNNDGQCELVVANPDESAIYSWSRENKMWRKLAYSLPRGALVVDKEGNDFGLRFVDFNVDGYDDVIFSNAESYGLYLFLPKPKEDWRFEVGWTRKIRAGKRTDGDLLAIPMIVRSGPNANNGAWFHSGHMWIQNEDTAHLPDKVDRRSFEQLLAFDSPPPKSPEDALKTIQVRPGFKVELVAAEPLVMDPIAFEWGADGKLWVVEMGDYPNGVDGTGKPGGIVRYLEDTDDDGRYDKSTVFLENLSFPTGVMPWRKGVLVSAAPEIFYAEDRDGDSKADHRITLFEGFVPGNQQHRVNGFEYGLDNWVYGANGDSGGDVRAMAGVIGKPRSKVTINLRGRDFRCQPDDGTFEAIEGQTQFGRRRDDWGNWFGNNNPNWGWHYWIAERYILRNRELPTRSVRQSLAQYPNSTRVFAISRPMQRFNWPNLVNTLTSANSLTPYRDELFGPEFETSVFISEPAHNLVHREELIPNGVTFDSRRPADEQDREFLASSDNWFRPTMLKTGPDGALHIADMYRLVIEHTEYALPGMENQIDVRAGADRGRIYRVLPEGAKLRKPRLLDKLTTAELVAALDSSSGWQRDTAQRLLVHSQEKRAVAPLRKLVRSSKNPKARLQALYTLDGLGALEPGDLQFGRRDEHPIVRAHSIRLTESDNIRGAADDIYALANDPDVRVRFQLALTVGEPKWPAEKSGPALAALATRDAADSHTRAAILSSAPACLDQLVTGLEKWPKKRTEILALRQQLLELSVALKRDESISMLLKPALTDTPGTETFALLNSFLTALRRRGVSFEKFAEQSSVPLRELLGKLSDVTDRAHKIAVDLNCEASQRAAAVTALCRLSPTEATAAQVANLLLPDQPNGVQKAALTALGELRSSEPAKIIVKLWNQLGPSIRVDAVELLLSRSEWTDVFLKALENNTVPRGQLPTAARQRLTNHRSQGIRKRAVALFDNASGDRLEVVRKYQATVRGDAQRGAALFRQHCATCHHFKGEGVALGPDLATLTDKSPESLLVAILDPNQSVETPFVNYTATMRDGRELSGIIANETGNSVTLRLAGGSEQVLLRNEIRDLTGSGLSLMPEGLEQALDPQQMADLIEYVLIE